MSRVKKAVVGLVVCAIIVAIVLPWVLVARGDTVSEEQGIVVEFIRAYGSQAQLLQLTNPKQFYVAYWQDDGYLNISLFLDGVWVQIGSQEVEE